MSARDVPYSCGSFSPDKFPVREWYLKRKFIMPDDENILILRIFNKNNLLNDTSNFYSDGKLHFFNKTLSKDTKK